MRVCILKSTGTLLEGQSNDAADLDVLISNAINAGYTADQITAKVVTQAEFHALVAATRPPRAPQIMSQDLMAQFTAADAALIQAAIASNAQFWLLWSAMQAQSDPMIVTNARFVAGWSGLVTILGQSRMNAIATALGVPSLVV